MLDEQQQAVNERIRAIYQKAQSRLGELVCYPRGGGKTYSHQPGWLVIRRIRLTAMASPD